ncbi:hybrid sensor histidine kinase/response regulator [Algibacter sp. PT7-4]|uniref:ATP-binding response regulator n=1 Tax=Algibacter ulvanivorans TaxID=3400999 RepID=UPI003AAB51AE
MLKTYIEKYHKNNLQYILIDNFGCVIDVNNPILPIKKNDKIENIHPFFDVLINLLPVKNETFEFSCVNIEVQNNKLVVDITIHTHNNNENLIIIENLTKHYNNYQLTAQTRNESIINSQILELKNEYLLEKQTFKNNFIANFSHQLRNPITASTIFSDLLINSNLNAEQKNYLNIIQAANKDLKNRIEDILDISKIEAGKLTLINKVFNLTELLNNLTVIYTYLCHKKGLKFNFTIDEKIPKFIIGDQYRLKQIIGNLINNAISNTSRGRINLTISLNYIRAKKANLHFEIKDTGKGIDKENLETIFNRFTKIESENEINNGVGLGLAIVKYLISEMNGNIKVESKINKGSNFIFNLSFNTSNYNQNKKEELLSKQLLNSDKKYHILLLEDSELIQLSILKMLASTGLFYINIISKGEELIPNIINNNVDIILLTNTILGYSAIDLASSVRNLPKAYKKTPIIVLSTQAYKEDIKRFKKNKINNVLVKPFDKETLLDSIKKCLQ